MYARLRWVYGVGTMASEFTREEIHQLWPDIRAAIAVMDGGYGFMARTAEDKCACDSTLGTVNK